MKVRFEEIIYNYKKELLKSLNSQLINVKRGKNKDFNFYYN
jgi:hypothetical protein